MKILIVEDEKKTGEYLTIGLTEAGFVVDLADNGLNGYHLAMTSDYDLLILDIMLPDVNGWDIVRMLRAANKGMPILLLTALGTIEHRVKGLELGADDYLVKPFAFAELLARVRTLLRRGAAVIVESQFQAADLSVDLVSRKVTRGATRITLTSKEFTLLEFFLRHQGEVLPRSLIASQVWDMNFDSDTNAIDVAVKRLRAKIDNDFEPKLIQTARGVGYMLDVPDDRQARVFRGDPADLLYRAGHHHRFLCLHLDHDPFGEAPLCRAGRSRSQAAQHHPGDGPRPR